MERTFLMVKPDGVQRGLIGEIVSRFERKGLKLVARSSCRLPRNWRNGTMRSIRESLLSAARSIYYVWSRIRYGMAGR